MRRYVSYTPGGIEVVYVPGDSVRSVTNEDHSYLTPGGYISDHGIRSHRVATAPKMDWPGHGIGAVITALTLALLADGATLLLIAWLNR